MQSIYEMTKDIPAFKSFLPKAFDSETRELGTNLREATEEESSGIQIILQAQGNEFDSQR